MTSVTIIVLLIRTRYHSDRLERVQMCVAYKELGGVPIVLLCQKPKAEMEAYFRCAAPTIHAVLGPFRPPQVQCRLGASLSSKHMTRPVLGVQLQRTLQPVQRPCPNHNVSTPSEVLHLAPYS